MLWLKQDQFDAHSPREGSSVAYLNDHEDDVANSNKEVDSDSIFLDSNWGS